MQVETSCILLVKYLLTSQQRTPDNPRLEPWALASRSQLLFPRGCLSVPGAIQNSLRQWLNLQNLLYYINIQYNMQHAKHWTPFFNSVLSDPAFSLVSTQTFTVELKQEARNWSGNWGYDPEMKQEVKLELNLEVKQELQQELKWKLKRELGICSTKWSWNWTVICSRNWSGNWVKQSCVSHAAKHTVYLLTIHLSPAETRTCWWILWL